MAHEQAPAVSVTMVLHNSEQELARSLAPIRPDVDSGFAEVIAVDNASPDASARAIEHELPQATIVRSTYNRGFAAGVNLAWPYVTARYWLLLNPDAELDDGGVRALVRWMDEHPSIGAASAELADETGRGPRSAGRALPSPWRVLLEASRMHLLFPARTRGRILRGAYWRDGDQLDAGWIPGTAMIARREAVESAGLPDEHFFLYGEDIDWCWRMRRAGWSIGVCSAVRARHREASSSARTFAEDDVRLRMIRGEIEAVRKARGSRYARLYARSVAFGLKLESFHPRRARQRRESAAAAARAWRRAAGGGPAG